MIVCNKGGETTVTVARTRATRSIVSPELSTRSGARAYHFVRPIHSFRLIIIFLVAVAIEQAIGAADNFTPFSGNDSLS
jgi:hypothetical protein